MCCFSLKDNEESAQRESVVPCLNFLEVRAPIRCSLQSIFAIILPILTILLIVVCIVKSRGCSDKYSDLSNIGKSLLVWDGNATILSDLDLLHCGEEI